MTLADDEKRRLAEEFKAEIADRYRARNAIRAQGTDAAADAEADREAEVAALRLEVQREYYEANGFVRHVDSYGTERWVSPEEAERLRHRRRRKKRTVYAKMWGGSTRRTVMFLVALAIASAIGLYMSM